MKKIKRIIEPNRKKGELEDVVSRYCLCSNVSHYILGL